MQVFAQETIKTDTLNITAIAQKEGLLQLNVKAIEQDELDYLWLATEDGLHRYNSLDFKIFNNNPLDSLSIPEDHARDLFITKDTLFIASNSKGVFGLKIDTEEFFNTSNKDLEQVENTSYRILPLNNTRLLFSLSNAFQLYDRKTKQVNTINLPKTEVENYVKCLVKIDDTKYLLATSASGLLLFNINDYTLNSYNSVDNSAHNTLFKFNDLLFVGTEKALYTIDLKTKLIANIIKDESVNCFYKKDENIILIGTDSGLFSYDLKTKLLIKNTLVGYNAVNYSPITINEITGDKKGNIWFGTEGEGFFHYNAYSEKFKTLKLRVPDFSKSKKISTFQFLPLKDSTFFIGSTSGIIKYNAISNQFKQYDQFKEELIYTFAEDFNGTIWSGGFTTGLLKYDKKKDRFVEVKDAENYISNRDVVQITPLNKNELLVATWSGGMHIYNISKNAFSNYLVNDKVLNRARTSFIDSKQNIWLGTDEGAFKISPKGKVTPFNNQVTDSRKINSNRIFAFAEDSKKNIWIGTSEGLTKLNPETLETKRYFKQKGLPNDFIYTVLIDKEDKIWVSTNLGISVLDTQEETFTNYTEKDGLQNNEFNGKAGIQDLHGNFYFGGINGINIFNPQQLKTSPFYPKVHIESVELFNTPINQGELYKNELEFSSNENVLTFDFSAINYLNPDKVDYSYFMEGFDNSWRPITKSRTTTYTNLNPGKYIFRVKATNANGDWSPIEDEMQLIIVPPWYKTMLFRVFSLFLFLFSGVCFYLYKIYKLKLDKAKLEKVVAQRTKDVSSKNEALQIAFHNSEKQQENIKFLMRELHHRVKNNLQIISSLLNIQSHHLENKPAVEALRVAKNRILAISYIEDKMKADNEIVRIKSFTIDLCASILEVLDIEDKLKFKVQYNIEDNTVKGLNTTVYGLILNELITNINKHAFNDSSKENKVIISCVRIDNTLILTIKDNGKGYNKTDIKPSSMGLDLVKDMVFQLDATLEVQSNDGTLNKIIIPIQDFN